MTDLNLVDGEISDEAIDEEIFYESNASAKMVAAASEIRSDKLSNSKVR